MTASASALPDFFEAHGGRLEAFDDGHCPETFRFQQQHNQGARDEAAGSAEGIGNGIAIPKILRYNLPTSAQPSNVHVYDGVLNPFDARMLYEATASSKGEQGSETGWKLKGESPWGTYVTIKEALEWIEWKEQYTQQSNAERFGEYLTSWRRKMLDFCRWRSNREATEEKKEEHLGDGYADKQLDDMDFVRHALAVEAVATFFLQTVPSRPGTTAVAAASRSSLSNAELFQSSQILEQAHGVAVWALSSYPGQCTQYHIDYAELLRYEYNVTVPPLWAGTIQCSELSNGNGSSDECSGAMHGGEFCVNLRGLEHYAEHGYKGNLSGDASGGWLRPVTEQCENGEVHVNNNNQWVTIPYAFNRGIVHRGDLPHLSAPVESINCPGISRVIVGFNVFGHDVGAHIAKAPEHSRTFRRKVRLYRSTINTCNRGTDSCTQKSGGMDLSQIRKNKGLTKLLVLAKREKVKEELRRQQKELSGKIWRRLLMHHRSGQLLEVTDIISEFGAPNDSLDGKWPKSIDVHVHLHHRMILSAVDEGEIAQQKEGSNFLFQDVEGVAGSPGTWYRIRTKNLSKEESCGGLLDASTQLDIVEHTR